MKINILVLTIIFAASASAHAQYTRTRICITPSAEDGLPRRRLSILPCATGSVLLETDSPAAILIQSWISDQCLAASAIRWRTSDR